MARQYDLDRYEIDLGDYEQLQPIDDQFIAEQIGQATGNFTPEVDIPTLTADANDLSLPEGTYFRLSTNGVARNITGFANVKGGRVAFLANTGGGANITLRNQNVGSITEQRIITGTGADVAVAPDQLVYIVYDSITKRWRLRA